MAVTEIYAGSQSVTTTEHSLTTDTTGPDVDTNAGNYQVVLDLNAMLNGDVFTFRGYEKAQAGDTQRKFLEFDFAHAQSTPNWISPQFMLLNGWDFTIIKTAGTDRTITWSIRKDDVAPTVAAIQSGLATAAALDTVDNFLDTEIAAIKAKTDLIPGTQDGLTWAQSVLLGQAVLLGKASGLDRKSVV